MNIYDIAMRLRRELLQGERESSRRLVDAYADAWLRIKRRLEQLTEAIEAAREAGASFSPSWLFQQRRYQLLLQEVRREIENLALAAQMDVVRNQSWALRQSEYATRALFEEVKLARSFVGLPASAFESIVGFLSDGSPLRKVLESLGESAAAEMEAALKSAVLVGMPPREIVRQVRKEAGGALSRLLTIARTETLRAYREGIRLSLDAAGYTHWRWVASLSLRTCPACLGMHGRVFAITEPFGTHPNCRCTLVPVDEGLTVPDAEDWLRGLSQVQQEQVLGKQRAHLWRQGRLQLKDFVRERHDPVWGTTRTVMPLRRGIA